MPSICRRVDDAILPQSATAKPGALQSMETLAEDRVVDATTDGGHDEGRAGAATQGAG